MNTLFDSQKQSNPATKPVNLDTRTDGQYGYQEDGFEIKKIKINNQNDFHGPDHSFDTLSDNEWKKLITNQIDIVNLGRHVQSRVNNGNLQLMNSYPDVRVNSAI